MPNSHRQTRLDKTVLRVGVGGVNRILLNSRLLPTERAEQLQSNGPIHITRSDATRQDSFVESRQKA